MGATESMTEVRYWIGERGRFSRRIQGDIVLPVSIEASDRRLAGVAVGFVPELLCGAGAVRRVSRILDMFCRDCQYCRARGSRVDRPTR